MSHKNGPPQPVRTKDAVDHLREFADWLEEHPTACRVLDIHGINDCPTGGRDGFLAQATMLGAYDWEQDTHGTVFVLSRSWGALTYKLVGERDELCERRAVSSIGLQWVPSISTLKALGARTVTG
jgi:hypothetical protein